MTEAVAVALIAAIPTTITALTLVQARRNHRDLSPQGDQTPGELLEETHGEVMAQRRGLTEIRRDLLAHINTAEPVLSRHAVQLEILQRLVEAHELEDRDSFNEIRQVLGIPPKD